MHCRARGPVDRASHHRRREDRLEQRSADALPAQRTHPALKEPDHHRRVPGELRAVGQDQADHPQRAEGGQGDDQVKAHAQDADQGRPQRVLAGVERKDQGLVHGGKDQTDQVDPQGQRRLSRIDGAELAVLEEQGDDGLRQHQQSHGSRDGQEQHEAQAARQRGPEPLAGAICALTLVFQPGLAGQRGQNGCGDGHRDQPERELDQRGRIVHPRDAGLAGPRGKVAVDEDPQAGDDQAEDDGRVEAEDVPQERIAEVECRTNAQIAQGRQLQDDLQCCTHHHARSQHADIPPT